MVIATIILGHLFRKVGILKSLKGPAVHALLSACYISGSCCKAGQLIFTLHVNVILSSDLLIYIYYFVCTNVQWAFMILIISHLRI